MFTSVEQNVRPTSIPQAYDQPASFQPYHAYC
jgi:hypothetical protein